MKGIRGVLMQRDGRTLAEAEELLEEAKEAFNGYMEEGREDLAEDICAEFFGLEPDYLEEFF